MSLTSVNSATARPPRPPARRGQYLKALRKAHGWLGLWGALLGLLFGASGILQNHRAVLKIDMPGPVVETLQLQAPADLPRTDAAVGRWLQQALKLDKPVERIRKEAAQDVRWGDVSARRAIRCRWNSGRKAAPPAPAAAAPVGGAWSRIFIAPTALAWPGCCYRTPSAAR